MPLGTTPEPQGLGNPPIDELMKHADSKYALSIFAAKRARQINSYFNQLNEGLPLVEYQNDDKPLSIAFREINEGLLEETLGADEKDDDLQAQKLINASTGISVSAADIVDAAAVDAEDEAEDANDVDEDDDSEEIESDALSLLNDNDEDDDSDDE